MRTILYCAFFLSGVAGLVYESIWSRYLGLFVGHTAYAQVIVLGIFLGGLSVGALLVGQWSERTRRPLLWYAGVELAVGIYGFLFHDLFVAAQDLAYGSLFPALAGSPFLNPVKWGLVAVLLIPPSVLLGTTFPFMSAGFIRLFPGAPGRVLSLLYFTNSYGAAMGALLAGFVLVAQFGLPGTVLSAAVLNAAAALLAWVVHKRAGMNVAAPTEVGSEGTDGIPTSGGGSLPDLGGGGWREGERDLWRLLLAVSFGTAAASFIYEIAWIRMLSLVLGTATHSFEVMLSAFILGLAAGSYWMRGRADLLKDPVRALGWIQLVMGISALATLPIYVSSFEWTAELLEALNRSPSGYRFFNLARYGVALAVMLPATFCAGTTLPLITRTLFATRAGERAIGWVYGLNTLGSIVGVAVASLILMPMVGLKPLLVVGGGLDMALGVMLFARVARRSDEGSRSRARLRSVGSAAVASAMILVVLLGVRLDRALLSSGVYRTGRLPMEGTEILFYRDGRTATVTADRKAPGVIALSTNGKPDATLSDRWLQPASSIQDTLPLSVDEPTQLLLALVTLAHNPTARTAVVVGQGSGVSSHTLLGSPHLEAVTTVEIEPEMLEGSRVFYPANRRAFDDPRAAFALDDAKSFLAQGGPSLDLVLSEPSNPWVSGVASLFSTEFYQRVRSRLAPGGVFGQWLHLYEISDLLVLSVLSALHSAFSDYQIFLVHNVDMLIVATAEGRLPPPDWSVFDLPAVAEDLARTYPFRPELLDRLRFLNRDALAPLMDSYGPPNSDFFPILDLGAEKTRFLRTPAVGFVESSTGPFDIADAFLPIPAATGETVWSPVPQISVSRGLALANRVRRALGERPASWGTGGSDINPPVASGTGSGEAASRTLPEEPDGEVRQALFSIQRAEALLRLEEAPADWVGWVSDVLAGAGWSAASGWQLVAPGLLPRMSARAEALGAPRGVAHVPRFVEALVARDWEGVVGTAEVLAEEAESGHHFFSPEILLDAGTTALLVNGDPVGARAFFSRLAPVAGRSPGDLRSRLLVAHLDRALSPR
jgi:predicted membrane-bound spermidine synthase